MKQPEVIFYAKLEEPRAVCIYDTRYADSDFARLFGHGVLNRDPKDTTMHFFITQGAVDRLLAQGTEPNQVKVLFAEGDTPKDTWQAVSLLDLVAAADSYVATKVEKPEADVGKELIRKIASIKQSLTPKSPQAPIPTPAPPQRELTLEERAIADWKRSEALRREFRLGGLPSYVAWLKNKDNVKLFKKGGVDNVR